MERYKDILIKLSNLQKELDECIRLSQEVSGSLEYNDRKTELLSKISDVKSELIAKAIFEE